MAVIPLNILEPTNDKAYFGSPTVIFRGTVIEHPKNLENVTLYYRWYSSINPGAKIDHYSINEIALTDPGTIFSAQIGVGSHVITLGVSDRIGQTAADLEAIQHGGVTGGSQGDIRCVIHVFKANMIEPVENSILYRNNCTLIAESPLIWGRAKPGTNLVEFEINPEYHKINRLQYRWEFIPRGLPDGRGTVNFIPAKNEYVFEQRSTLMVIRYTGPLPADLNGDYQLILHVEDQKGILGGHQALISKCSLIG